LQTPAAGMDVPTLENGILSLIETFEDLANQIDSKVNHLALESQE
jgi:hypothetical protein